MDDERIEFPVLAAMHAAHDDLVITSRVDMLCTAFQAGGKLGENRYAVNSLTAIKRRELIVATLRKSIGQFLLMLRQHVYGKIFGAGENIVAQ